MLKSMRFAFLGFFLIQSLNCYSENLSETRKIQPEILTKSYPAIRQSIKKRIKIKKTDKEDDDSSEEKIRQKKKEDIESDIVEEFYPIGWETKNKEIIE